MRKIYAVSVLCLMCFTLLAVEFCNTNIASADLSPEGLKALKQYLYQNNNDIKAIRKKAENGDAEAQLNMGRMYNQGEGVGQNYKLAAEWFRKAADQVYAMAQYNLGVMYDNGEGVSRNYKQATDWYRKAADQGLPEAKEALNKINSNR